MYLHLLDRRFRRGLVMSDEELQGGHERLKHREAVFRRAPNPRNESEDLSQYRVNEPPVARRSQEYEAV
jgi:hypothetical protein